MAPSLAPQMTLSPGATPSKQPRRMVPIIPAIPRSLEKRKLKQDVKGNEDGGGVGSPIRPIPGEGKEGSQETAVAVQNEALNGLDTKDDVQGNVVQEAVVEAPENAGSEKEVATVGGDSTFQSTLVPGTNEQKSTTSAADGINLSPVHAEDFGIEKHGFRLPPPFYPKRSPPPAISTDFSSANEKDIASEETSQSVEEEDGSNMSQQSSAENHVTLNAAAPTFHAHPTPPTDVTTSPTESSYKGYDLAQSIHLQQESTLPTDDTLSPIQQPYQGYDISQNISFYAPPQSSDDPSSPDHSIYQGYAYAPASYEYSPQSHPSQHPIDLPHGTQVGVPYEQTYEPQPPYYSNQSPHPILGSQPPLTPSRTPLDPSAQPWSCSNGPPTTPFSYGYMPSFHPQPTSESCFPSTSHEILKSDEFAREADVVDNTPKPVQLNVVEKKTAQLLRDSWRNLNDCMSSHVPLVEHLLQQFNNEEYADCQLTLVHENLRFEKITWSLSSLLLAQSNKLRDLLKSAGQSAEGKRRLEIRLTDRFVTPWAMNSALRVLYGERPEMFTLAMIHSTFDANAETWAFQMDACLAFTAAGHVLGLENVVLKGLQIAHSILDWENLENALSFGLESGPNRGTSASVDVIPLSSYSTVWPRESDHPSALNLTPPSSSTESRPEHSDQPGARDEGISSVNSYTAEVRSAWDLQMRCLQWMASNLDDFWHFDPSARPLAEVDRLPTTAESRSPLFKSRLSRIQFGDHPSELHAKASNRNFLVSSIVLSLPFAALKYLLEVGTQPISRQLHAIVKERERRRQIVLQSKSVPWSQRLTAREHEWAEVGYTERVETTGDGQVSLARCFTGIDRQASEPSTPDKQKR
ncbi:hypothetical protein HO173_010740 [Letharia columbiana]|uniref:Uncharacterized protein n=1 Tax=Letharia columbiana TaxID=112416 RepID=A0A8H6FM27_9LECA|nr:uncharacterized protein HO173_010740 [Letharia columbiana]KAF6231040.1 hypothetical protein HO173_010740 [Letharia columbiana]